MSEVTMSAAVHFSFLSFDDALITVSRSADDAFAVGFPAILAILDDVALVVSDDYSKSVIHGKLSLEMVFVLVSLVLRAHCAIDNLFSFVLCFTHSSAFFLFLIPALRL